MGRNMWNDNTKVYLFELDVGCKLLTMHEGVTFVDQSPVGPSVMNLLQSCCAVWVTTCLCLCEINANLRFSESQSSKLTGPSCWHTISCHVWLPQLAQGGINQRAHMHNKYTVPCFSHHIGLNILCHSTSYFSWGLTGVKCEQNFR